MPLDAPAPDRHDGEFARRLSAAMDNAVGTLPPPPPDLVSQATVRGRRLRLMRALQVAGGTALVVATLGGTLIGTWNLGDRAAPPHDEIPAATRFPDQATPEPTTPTVSAQDMVDTLEGLLPKGGTVSNASGRGSRAGNGLSLTAQLTYTRAQGTSGLDISIRRLSPDIPRDQQAGGCLPIEVRPYDVCTTTRLPGGSVLHATKSFTYPSSDTGQRRWYVELVTGDGADLFLQEFGGGEKGSTGGSDPVLSVSQLGTIVRSPAWNRAISAATTPDAAEPPVSRRQTLSGDRMAAALVSLLPKGGVTSEQNSSPGLVQLVYDDGRGKNMVEVDVQNNMTKLLADHMGCAGVSGACQSTTLADGTKVKLTRQDSEKGGSAVVWIADTLRPDGRRVAVRECNSYAESGPVTRPEPALSMTQLRAMALSPKWLG